ncbi:MAG: SDR family oxidoreductase [Acidobacteria bacterium]|nr:SDR family oxidoreductase [Acidobacteriota bacterium]
MTTLITGAGGLLGAHMAAALDGQRVIGLDRHSAWGGLDTEMIQGDLLDDGWLTRTVGQVAPSVVVHCAAMVDVDACERQPALAEAYNVGMTRTLARAVSPGALFVYIATDGIFDGRAPYRTEADVPRPLTAYGRSKLCGEHEVRTACGNHLIVRTNFYGWSSGRKKTSAEWLYGALDRGEPITGFTDFYFTPIYVVDFVNRLRRLMASSHRGTFHLCGSERVSKHQFAMRLAEVAGLPTASLRAGSIEDAQLAAPRPRDMSLSSRRFTALTDLEVPDCLSGLRRFVPDRIRPLSERFVDARG